MNIEVLNGNPASANRLQSQQSYFDRVQYPSAHRVHMTAFTLVPRSELNCQCESILNDMNLSGHLFYCINV